MNRLHAAQPAVAAFPDPGHPGHPDDLLLELLTWNEGMVINLRLQRLSVVSTANFLSRLIDEHEETAARLRIRLAGPGQSPPEVPAIHPTTIPFLIT